MLFTCVCEGKLVMNKSDTDERKNNRRTSTLKTGCGVKMRIRRTEEGSWICSVFENDHNHVMVSPNKRMLMRCRRTMPQSAKDLAVRFKENNIEVCKVAALYGEDATFSMRDVWSHMQWHRKVTYEEGDAEKVKLYFQEMAAKDPLFFYAIQCDTEGRAANFFWVDAQSRKAYSQFGDAVTFDTTYRTNKYCMPFAPFTGINHHRQSVVFGCALLENEQEYTFIWLFETWLQAMCGKAPISFLTDQDLAMGKAIAHVFPQTRHRFCLWHIKKKFTEKFGYLYAKRSTFKRAVKKCTRGARSIEDFENQWACLMQKYGLEDNSWLKSMYAIRRFWIPIYCRDTFFAGMNTTQRSESINSFFGGFVSQGTNLLTFVTKYAIAVETIRKVERQEDFDSRNKKRVLHNKDPILAHAVEVYTKNMFKVVAEEVEEVIALQVEQKCVDGDIYKLVVQYKVGKYEEVVVTFNLTTKMGSCECQLFDFLGIPCRHLMKVFDHFRIYQIPAHFIMNRWCKYANRVALLESDGIPTEDSNSEVVSRGARFGELCRMATEVSHEACESEMGYKLFKDCMLKCVSEIREINEIIQHQENHNNEVDTNDQEMQLGTLTSEPPIIGTAASRVEVVLLDPNISQTKGRKKTIYQETDSQVDKISKGGRWKSGLEKATKKPRVCKTCKNEHGFQHDSRNCPRNPNAKGKQMAHMECDNDGIEDLD